MGLIKRRPTKAIHVGSVGVGGEYPVSVQSMTNTHTADVKSTLQQIYELARLKCDIVRVTVPDKESAKAVEQIVRESPLPIVADIHFDYKLALASLAGGVHGLRLNPGNIGASWKVAEVVKAARERKVPIRIGVNGGSLDKKYLEKYGGPTADALVASAMEHVRILEDLGYQEIKVSLKSSHVPTMIEAYQKISRLVDYPLHLGVTEAGLPEYGIIKSAVGIGALLAQGIGDTIRVSLTADPLAEVPVARKILQSLGLQKQELQVISCPTCGRTEVDLQAMAQMVSDRLKNDPLLADKPLTVAVMGCVVNGPGEAREADLGVACGKGVGLLFAGGKKLKTVPESEVPQAIIEEAYKIIQEQEKE